MNFLMCFTQTAAGHRRYLLSTICSEKSTNYFAFKTKLKATSWKLVQTKNVNQTGYLTSYRVKTGMRIYAVKQTMHEDKTYNLLQSLFHTLRILMSVCSLRYYCQLGPNHILIKYLNTLGLKRTSLVQNEPKYGKYMNKFRFWLIEFGLTWTREILKWTHVKYHRLHPPRCYYVKQSSAHV